MSHRHTKSTRSSITHTQNPPGHTHKISTRSQTHKIHQVTQTQNPPEVRLCHCSMNLKNQCLLLLSQTLKPTLLQSKYTQPAVSKLTGRLVESGWAHLGAQVRMISPSGSISRSHHMKIASTVPSTCDSTLTSELSRFFSDPGWLKSNLHTQPSLPHTQHLSALSAQLSLNWTLSRHLLSFIPACSPYLRLHLTTWTCLIQAPACHSCELMDTAGNSVNSCQNWTYGHCWQLCESMSELNLWTLLAVLWTYVSTVQENCWQFHEPMSEL